MQQPTKRTHEQKFILIFQAVKRSLLAAQLKAAEIRSGLALLEPLINANLSIRHLAPPPLLNAIAFVDFADRFGQLVEALPKISQKPEPMKRLLAAMRPVRQARHYLQHIRRELGVDGEIDYPSLGGLSWIGDGKCYAVFLPQATTSSFPSIALDTHRGVWATTLMYEVRTYQLDVDAISAAMDAAYTHITSLVQFSDPSFAELTWDEFAGFAFFPTTQAPSTGDNGT